MDDVQNPGRQPGIAKHPGFRGGQAICLVDTASQTALLTPEAASLLGITPVAEPHRVRLGDLPVTISELASECGERGASLPQREDMLTLVSGTRLELELSAFFCGPQVIIVLQNQAKQVEQALGRLERLASIGTLSAMMAHEIKNALVASKTFVDLLLEKQPEAELGTIVRRELGRIDEISGRVLRFVNPGEPTRAPFHLHNSLDYLLRLVQPQMRSHNLQLRCQFDARPDLLTGSEPDLQQAFLNLLLNAFEAMGQSGTLTITTQNLSPASPGGPDRLRLTVQDTGPGMCEEGCRNLFQPFFTTKPNGTGLGLPITERIVREHRGVVSLENPSEPGAKFAIILPVS